MGWEAVVGPEPEIRVPRQHTARTFPTNSIFSFSKNAAIDGPTFDLIRMRPNAPACVVDLRVLWRLRYGLVRVKLTNDEPIGGKEDAALLFAGPGEVRSIARELDWSASPLGLTTSWSPAIRTLARSMFDSPFPICLWSGPEFALIYNDPYRRILAAKHPAALGQPGAQVWAEIWDELRPQFEGVRAGGAPVYFENAPFDMARLEGGGTETAYFNYSLSPLRDDDGSVVAVLNITPETTAGVRLEKRLQAEQSALAASQERLRHLNETLAAQVEARSAERDRLWTLSQDMMARADYSGMMSAVSPAWTQVLGWSEQELLSRGYATFMHPEDEPPTLEAIGRMAETGQPTSFENRIATSDGTWKSIEWTVAPEADGINFVAVGRDLTAAKVREAELELARDALRQSQKMEAMGSLTGGVAHDFNNLLTPIIGSLDMLVRKGVGDVRQQRLIDGALQSAERAKILVQRLLAFARRQPLQPTAVDIPDLLEGMTGLLGSTLGPKIDIRVDLAADLPPAQADPNQLEMALLNLAVNARDAMPEGGVLTLSARRRNVRTPHPAGVRRGHYLALSVSDTGVGMDDATQRRATEPFFSTKGIGKGTGLGLSMVHGLAAQLGGGLAINSAPGKGTTIELILPVSSHPVASETRSFAPSPLAKARGVALLVEDEELVRMSTAHMLTDMGFEVVEASSGEEALSIVRTGLTPDVVVTDHLMPGMSGDELARTLRAERAELPVLIVSGYAEAEGIDPTVARLTKPFRNADLEDSLLRLVDAGV